MIADEVDSSAGRINETFQLADAEQQRGRAPALVHQHQIGLAEPTRTQHVAAAGFDQLARNVPGHGFFSPLSAQMRLTTVKRMHGDFNRALRVGRRLSGTVPSSRTVQRPR